MTDARDKPLKGLKVRDVDGGAEMLDADAPGRFEHLLAVVARELWYWKRAVKKTTLAGTNLRGWEYRSDPTLYPLRPLALALLRGLTASPPPLPYEAVLQLLDAATIPRVGEEVRTYVPIEKLLPLATAACAVGGVNDRMLDALQELRRLVTPGGHDFGSRLRERRELTEQIDAIINPQARTAGAAAAKPSPVEPGEPWADAVSLELRGPAGAKWVALLEYAAGAVGSQPTQKWLKGSKPLVEAVGIDAFATSMGKWLELAQRPRTAAMNQEQLRVTAFGLHDPMADLFSPKNEEALKGLVWIAGGADRPALAGGLGMLAERCYKKIPQIGPRSAKVANACLVALTSMTGRQATAELSRLKSIVKQPTGRKMIERALSCVAGEQGVTVEDLEETTVPTFALVEGVTERKLGGVTLRIALTPRGEVEQSWTGGDGKARKSAPASVKAEHGAALKAIKKELADLDKTLTAQRLRIERLFLRRTPWAFEAWREAYHEHPLVQTLSRRLIWTFETDGKPFVAAWDGKRFVTAAGEPVAIDPAKTRVRLWHPSSANGEEVLAWRRWLETREITQPFKQAHREIYLLTDAERRTRTYSNRFAQHVIRQHQFQALCQQRGWKYQLMGGFDFHNYPTLEIPTWDTKVEFWVEVAPGTGMSANGIATHLSTDQVRFLDPRGGEARPLGDVPPLLMSEVFRDVDLFVAVTSAGNDPAWQDGGPDGRFRDYWHATSFGELTASAVTRKAVLESLLPRLSKLKDKWSLVDRFLVIKGSRRTYKIHLGSGNILMAPNDQYLCIVPDASARAGDNVFLPFEGDATLSIILSKAFLLAQDAEITDPTIARQIDAK